MSAIAIPRSSRHHGSTGKTLLPTLMVGAMTDAGPIIQVRKKKKYPKRYRVALIGLDAAQWLRRDEFVVVNIPSAES
jgi:hypothetical protein